MSIMSDANLHAVCGNDRPAKKALEADCDMPCTGDEEQPCGAGNRLTVFTSDLSAPAVAGWKYSGCYKDSVAERVLTGDFYADGDGMTHEDCIEFCVKGSFRYAGVEYGAECCKLLLKSIRFAIMIVQGN
jgi:hypothetical protein